MFEMMADWLIYEMAGLRGSQLGDAAHFFVMDVSKIMVLLTLVIYVMGLLRALLKPERVREFIRKRGNVSSRFMAVGLGAVTPFCSCSSVPLFIGFVEAGIPLGVTLSFLIASPMVNEVAIVVLATVIGWKMIGGFVLERFKPERWVEEYVWQIKMGDAALEAEVMTLKLRHEYAWAQVREIVGRIWKYVLIGVGVGALMHGYVPREFIASVAGEGGLLSVVGAVLVGVPLYSDAVGIIPVAEVLLQKGVPLGTVLAFMMAVVALSLPEMLILRKVVKWPLLALFAAYLATAFVVTGMLFNNLDGLL
jgi:hypothetical protein